MKKLWTILLVTMIGFNFEIISQNKNKKSWTFDANKHSNKPKKNIELLISTDNILDKIQDSHQEVKNKHNTINKPNQDIIRLQKIKQHLKKLDLDNSDIKNETQKEIKSYQINKHNLIKSALQNIDHLITIEHHLIELEKINTTNNEKVKLSHKKSKEQIIVMIKAKVEHLLKIERKLLELTKNNPKEYHEAEEIYYETEYLKGPEIHDRETFSIDDAQYRDHLRKDISKYTPDYHEKIRNYLWSNT